MSEQKILNQDEIDALIHGVDRGAVSTESAAPPGEARKKASGNSIDQTVQVDRSFRGLQVGAGRRTGSTRLTTGHG